MITLITGVPGSGKTLFLIGLLRDIHASGRKIYQSGITDLTIENQLLSDDDLRLGSGISVFDPEKSRFKIKPDFELGSVIVIDECQRFWSPSHSSKKIPDDIQCLETHRHDGVDIIILSQHPNLLHSNVRRFVGRHFHIRNVGVLGRFIYEWPECADVNRFNTCLIKKRYKLDKKLFNLYKSSSTHIKHKYTIPKPLIVVIVSLILIAFLSFSFFGSLKSKINPDNNVVKQTGTESVKQPVFNHDSDLKKLDSEPFSAQFIARDSSYPESAPAFDSLRVVKQMPIISACVEIRSDCRCFSQQGTLLHSDRVSCLDFVKNGRFNYYRDDSIKNERVQIDRAVADSSDVERPGTVADESEGRATSATGAGTLTSSRERRIEHRKNNVH